MIPLTFCFTTFNRVSLTIKAVNSIIDDSRIENIIVLDDHSEPNVFDQLFHYFRDFPKVSLYRNEENLGMSKNKAKAISLSPTEWCVIVDSDNTFPKEYIDAIEKVGELLPDTIYCPQKAAPNFDFSKFAGRTFDRNNIKELAIDSMGNVCLNTANYVVNKDEYLRVYQYNSEMKATDTVWFALLWLSIGNKFHIVKDMEYDHLVWEGSGFMKDCDYNMNQSAILRQQILQLT